MATTPATRPEAGQSARERILGTAYELFSHRGVHDVGIDELVERAGVAKATLYKHFPSKDELVLAFLEQREQIWTYGWVEREARRRGGTPEEQLLAIFDLFDEWFHRDDFEGCSFVNVLLEFGDLDHPVGRASADYLENIRCRSQPRARGRTARPRRLRTLLAHPDEGLDRAGCRGRPRRGETRAGAR